MFHPWLTVLIVAVLLALLVWLLPEVVRWLAVRNNHNRDDLVRRIRLLERNLEEMGRQLARYEQRRSKHYHDLYQQIRPHLEDVQTTRQTMFSNSRLKFPRLSPDGWAGFYFGRQPRTVWATWRTFWQLRRYQAQLDKSEAELELIQSGLEQLRAMPFLLQQECVSLQQRLYAIGDLLGAEQQWGIRLPVEMSDIRGRLQEETLELLSLLAQPEQVPDDEAEEIDERLTAVHRDATRLEQDAQTIYQRRRAYEAQEAGVITAEQALHERIDSETALNLAEPLFNAIYRLRTEARRLCQERSFDRAIARLAESQQLITFGDKLYVAASQVNSLEQRQEDALNPEATNHLSTQLDRIWATFYEWVGNGEDIAAVTAVIQQLDNLTSRLQRIETQAQTVDKQFWADVERLEREAKAKTAELNKAWKAMQRTMTLAEGEPLARAYRAVSQQYQAAQNSPVRLTAYNALMAELTKDLQESNAYLQERLQTVGELVNVLPEFVRQIEAEAGEWRCLQQQVDNIKEKTTAMQQNWLKATKTGWLDETHQLLDEIKLLNQERLQSYAQMHSQSDQINRIMEQIEDMIAALEPTRQDDAHNKVAMRYDWAWQDTDFNRAIASLEEAKSIVRELETK